MQVTKKNLSDTRVQLLVVASTDQLQAAKTAALEHLAQDVKLSGFRKGKAPAALIEKNINQATLQTEFLDRAMNLIYGDLVEKEDLRPVSQPKVDIKKYVPFDTLELQFEVDVVGKVTLPDYTKMKKALPKVTVTPKDVDAVLKQLQKREAEKKEVNRAAKLGDEVLLDFSGSDAKTKEAIKGADGQNYPLTLGSKSFIPGFEEEVVGLKPGEEKTFTVTFPEDYGVPSLQKRKVTFVIKVHKVLELSEPKIDDALAAKVGPFKTVDELKADIKKQLETEQQHQADRTFTDELLLEITKKSKAAIPESLLEEQIDRLVNEQKQNLMYRGQTWQEFLDEQKLTEEEYRKQQREEAELRVKAGIVLGEIAEREKIMVSAEELEIRIQILKSQYPDAQMQAELDKAESRREIASRLVSEKTIHKLKEYAAAKPGAVSAKSAKSPKK
jgi:trigger factor